MKLLNELLELTRPLFVLDTETTGLDVTKDRVIELGFQEWGAAGVVKEWRTLVDPGIPIPATATAIHGITDAMIKSCRLCGRPRTVIDDACPGFKPWPTFTQLASNLSGGLSGCDFAGQNIRFDLRILAAEFMRAGFAWGYAGARIIDTSQIERLAVPRHLTDLHRKYAGHEHDGAHGALSDVRAAATVLARQLEEHPNLPRDLDKLHHEQWPDWIDTEGKFRFADGVPQIMFGKHRGTAMKDVPRDYWKWVTAADFPNEVKKIAAEAMLGAFPTTEPKKETA